MHLFKTQKYIERRKMLCEKVGSGLILLLGNDEAPMNYKDNVYRYRQDSTFLYYFGLDMPGLNATIDAASGECVIYGHEYTMDDIIWIGPSPSLASLAERIGIEQVSPPSDLWKLLQSTSNKDIHYLPPYRYDNLIKLSDWLGLHHSDIKQNVSLLLTKAVVSMRSYKDEDEVDQMVDAVNMTGEMHITAMEMTKVGVKEHETVASLYATAKYYDCYLAYPAIFSVNGQTLHNHHHHHTMQDGQLVLNDSGIENKMRYAGDITRTFPVSGRFTQKQKDIYSIVLEMEEECIASLQPNKLYRDYHLLAYRIMLTRFKELGLLKGDVDDMLDQGVAGMFMPHGLGHMIGLDVHDMEDLGEQYVGYRNGLNRSEQLGLKSLRLARELEAGFAITVEPGIYFIPELIKKNHSEGQFKDFVNFERLESYLDFGGIRIEDNVLITENGYEVLGEPIPKTIEEIEDVMN